MVKGFHQGGVEVEMFRSLTHDAELVQLALPSQAILSLSQYPGGRAQWDVSLGDHVEEDQKIASGQRAQDVPLHSPIPGVVEAFQEKRLPNGNLSSTVIIRLDGNFARTGKVVPRREWHGFKSDQLLRWIWENGVFFESSTIDSVWNILDISIPIKNLIINGVQNEPYLTAPTLIMGEKSAEIAEGIQILQEIFQPQKTLFASDPDFPEDWHNLYREMLPGVELVSVRQRYPQAQERILWQTLKGTLGGEGFNRRENLIVGLDTLLAVHDAVVWSRPYTEKLITLSGHGVVSPGIYRVKVGTPIAQILADTGGLTPDASQILVGGPFCGLPVEDLSLPVTKSTQAVLVLTDQELGPQKTYPCIRCAACVSSCPVGINPVEIYQLLTRGQGEQAQREGLPSCIRCGICSFVCPSRVPLLETFLLLGGKHA